MARAAALPALLAVAALALAGCSGGDGGTATSGGPTQDIAPGTVEGWVFDPGIRPVAGATVKVLETNASATTDANGRYELAGLPTERFVVLVATKESFIPRSQQVTLPPTGMVRLNFTLEPVPVKTPYVVVDKFEGFLACGGSLDLQGNVMPLDCSSGQEEHADVWEFSSGPDLAGAVIEVFWEPVQAGAESLHARLETLGLGDRNLVLGEAIGASPLRISIPADTAARYFAEGGQYRLTVAAQPNSDETEAGAGGAIALQQPFEAFYSFFHVVGPAPTYTVADAS